MKKCNVPSCNNDMTDCRFTCRSCWSKGIDLPFAKSSNFSSDSEEAKAFYEAVDKKRLAQIKPINKCDFVDCDNEKQGVYWCNHCYGKALKAKEDYDAAGRPTLKEHNTVERVAYYNEQYLKRQSQKTPDTTKDKCKVDGCSQELYQNNTYTCSDHCKEYGRSPVSDVVTWVMQKNGQKIKRNLEKIQVERKQGERIYLLWNGSCDLEIHPKGKPSFNLVSGDMIAMEETKFLEIVFPEKADGVLTHCIKLPEGGIIDGIHVVKNGKIDDVERDKKPFVSAAPTDTRIGDLMPITLNIDFDYDKDQLKRFGEQIDKHLDTARALKASLKESEKLSADTLAKIQKAIDAQEKQDACKTSEATATKIQKEVQMKCEINTCKEQATDYSKTCSARLCTDHQDEADAEPCSYRSFVNETNSKIALDIPTTQQEESKMSQSINTLPMLKEDATDAGWRLAGRQFTKLTNETLAAFIARNLDKDDPSMRAKVAEFLKTDLGKAVHQSLLSMGLSLMPDAAGDVPKRLARELRTEAMAEVGDQVADLLMEPLRQVASLYLQGVPQQEAKSLPAQSQDRVKVEIPITVNAEVAK